MQEQFDRNRQLVALAFAAKRSLTCSKTEMIAGNKVTASTRLTSVGREVDYRLNGKPISREALIKALT